MIVDSQQNPEDLKSSCSNIVIEKSDHPGAAQVDHRMSINEIGSNKSSEGDITGAN